MLYGLVPRSTHASAPHWTYTEAKALSLLSGIVRFSEVQAKHVKSKLAVPVECRVWEVHKEFWSKYQLWEIIKTH